MEAYGFATDGEDRAVRTPVLDASAALVRAEVDHLDATLRALATRLSTVPGLKVKVGYRQGRLRRLVGDLPYINDLNRRTGPVARLAVACGPVSYWVHAEHGSIKCGREQHGALAEELPFSSWASRLFDEVVEQNLLNYEAMAALRRLVEQDRVG